MSHRSKITFLQYIGGKSLLVPTLRDLLRPHKCYVEVFGGAAQLLFSKKPSKVEVYNDIDGRLVNLFRIARDRGPELQERLEQLLYSRRQYLEFRNSVETGDPLEDAVRFYYVLRCSFNGEVSAGWKHGTVKNEAKVYYSTVSQLGQVFIRLKNVQIEELDFRECIRTYDRKRTFFFIDPPYYDVTAYKYRFTVKDHEDLAELLRRVKGKWLLTYNDHPRIRHLYAGFNLMVKKLPVITRLIFARQKRPTWDQLIIANYPLARQQQLLQTTLFSRGVRVPLRLRPFKGQRPKIRSA